MLKSELKQTRSETVKWKNKVERRNKISSKFIDTYDLNTLWYDFVFDMLSNKLQ